MYSQNYYSTPSYGASVAGAVASIVIPILVAIVGSLLINFLFLSPKNENRFSGFLGKLYDFLRFKVMFSELLLRLLYYSLAIMITVYSFILLFSGQVGIFFLLIIFGNILIRILFEFFLIKLVISRNVSEINKKLGRNGNEHPQGGFQTDIPQYSFDSASADSSKPSCTFCPNCGTRITSNDKVCPNCQNENPTYREI